MNIDIIIEKFKEQANKNGELQKEIELLKKNIGNEVAVINERMQYIKANAPSSSSMILEFYNAISSQIEKIQLRGENLFIGEVDLGKVKGFDGKDGLDGKNGLDGIRGEKGEKGFDGKDGLDGKNGINGRDGKDGKNGATPVLGVSKTHILLNGKPFISLETLKGKDGRDGINSRALQNLYEMLVENGYTKTEDEMLNDIKILSQSDIQSWNNKQDTISVSTDLIKNQNMIGVNGGSIIRQHTSLADYKVGDITVLPFRALYSVNFNNIETNVVRFIRCIKDHTSGSVGFDFNPNFWEDLGCFYSAYQAEYQSPLWYSIDRRQEKKLYKSSVQTSITLVENTEICLGTPTSITLSLPTNGVCYESTIIFSTVDTTIPFITQSDIRFSGVDCDEDYYFIPTPHKKYRIDFCNVENEIWGDVKARLDPVPYLRDGLMCWFDGILNKQDSHDTITQYWYDRLTQANKLIWNFGYSVNSVEQIYWKENCLYSKNNGNGKSAYIKTGFYSTDAKIKSFEIVLKNIGNGTIQIGSRYGDSGYETNAKVIFSIDGSSIMIWHKDKSNVNKALDFPYRNFNVRHTYTFTLSDFDTVNSRVYCYLYIDGVKTNTYTLNNATQENAYFKVESVLGSGWETNEIETYSLRLYNKQLTDSQITSHFQIDSKRFK